MQPSKGGKVHISYTTTHQTFGQGQTYQGDRYIPCRSDELEYCFETEDAPAPCNKNEQEEDMDVDEPEESQTANGQDSQSNQLYRTLL